MKRRDLLKLGLVAGGSELLARQKAAGNDLLQFLCRPDGTPPDLLARPSPPARPFVTPLFIPPVKQPVAGLNPPPDPLAHQLYDDHLPRKFYEIRETEFLWRYHIDPPYDQGSWSWGFDNMTPGPTYHARYGEPVLVRRFNELPPVGVSNVTFALPSTSIHLHNGHTASESDGNPADWIDPGEYWDHHYANFPAGVHSFPELDAQQLAREKLATLWYHDHRLDFTASNVYAGLVGFYLLFDDRDTGNETDPAPAWGLPSGKYDIPLILHDILFDEDGQAVFDVFNTDGILGDRFTVNRTIQPFLEVERRKYRFRILNGGPSRFYRIYLDNGEPFLVITGDGNFQPEPLWARSIYLSVAQRVDFILDFSQYSAGEEITIVNRLEQTNGKGPTGRMLEPGDGLIRFIVKGDPVDDPSRVPLRFRELPRLPAPDVIRGLKERVWEFDYDGGLWTINGRVMDPNRIDAGVPQGSEEVWVFRNAGNDWAHPIHVHFNEFLMLEINGQPFPFTHIETRAESDRLDLDEAFDPATRWTDPEVKANPHDPFMGGPRRDIVTLLPNDDIKVYMRFPDFLGKYVMHCHNVVHEDHAMMMRWDILPPDSNSIDVPTDEDRFAGPEPAVLRPRDTRPGKPHPP